MWVSVMLTVVFLPPDPDTLPDTAKRNLQVPENMRMCNDS